MLFSPVKHDNTTQDHNQDTRQDNQAGEYEKLKLWNIIPWGRAEGLIDIDEDQRKKSSPQNQLHDMLLIVDVCWYIFIPHAHA